MHLLQMSMNKGRIDRERSRVVVVIAQRPSNLFFFRYLVTKGGYSIMRLKKVIQVYTN